MRLNRILSLAGLTSRRRADQWIEAGRVAVNGRKVTTPGTRAFWGRDAILVDGRPVPAPSARTYLVLNKPFGYVSSLRDPEGRPVITDLLKDVPQRVYPVGRLDFDSLGLLLLTNDGEWAHRLAHPRYRVPRTYKATVAGDITDHALGRLERGVDLEDGFSGPSRIALVSRTSRQSIVRITITRGRTRLVRRMFEAAGYRVVHLIRIGFGSLSLGNLRVGAYRHLETEEIASLKKLVGMR